MARYGAGGSSFQENVDMAIDFFCKPNTGTDDTSGPGDFSNERIKAMIDHVPLIRTIGPRCMMAKYVCQHARLVLR